MFIESYCGCRLHMILDFAVKKLNFSKKTLKTIKYKELNPISAESENTGLFYEFPSFRAF